MATDRTAIDTITGYYYQFDYYILELLRCDDPTTAVCIEAIEDVDITTADETTAVQCKYYAKTELQPSTLKRPIQLMLGHFACNLSTRGSLRYSLYGHYKSGQDNIPAVIDLDYLKNKFLTYTSTETDATTKVKKKVEHRVHEDLGLSDAELQLFLKQLHIDVNAPSFEDQEAQIITLLKGQFHCSDMEAEFYYSNALRLIRELSTRQAMTDRAITAEQFRKQINTSSQLFDTWYLKFRGQKAYCAAVRKQYFSSLNISPDARFFLIDCDKQSGVQEIKSLILLLIRKWSKLSKYEAYSFCPYVLLHGATPEMIVEVKRALYNDGIRFRDGYNFLGADYDPDSIVVRPTYTNGITLKFLTQLDQLDGTLDACRKRTRVVYQFYLDEPYYNPDSGDFMVHSIRITETSHITQMI